MPEVVTGREHLIGLRIRRKEDPRFLRGVAQYVEDIRLHGMKYAAVLRSPHARAWMRGIDTREALDLPGVVTGLPTKIFRTWPSESRCGWRLILPSINVCNPLWPRGRSDT